MPLLKSNRRSKAVPGAVARQLDAALERVRGEPESVQKAAIAAFLTRHEGKAYIGSLRALARVRGAIAWALA
jgi:hypothetical protein